MPPRQRPRPQQVRETRAANCQLAASCTEWAAHRNLARRSVSVPASPSGTACSCPPPPLTSASSASNISSSARATGASSIMMLIANLRTRVRPPSHAAAHSTDWRVACCVMAPAMACSTSGGISGTKTASHRPGGISCTYSNSRGGSRRNRANWRVNSAGPAGGASGWRVGISFARHALTREAAWARSAAAAAEAELSPVGTARGTSGALHCAPGSFLSAAWVASRRRRAASALSSSCRRLGRAREGGVRRMRVHLHHISWRGGVGGAAQSAGTYPEIGQGGRVWAAGLSRLDRASPLRAPAPQPNLGQAPPLRPPPWLPSEQPQARRQKPTAAWLASRRLPRRPLAAPPGASRPPCAAPWPADTFGAWRGAGQTRESQQARPGMPPALRPIAPARQAQAQRDIDPSQRMSHPVRWTGALRRAMPRGIRVQPKRPSGWSGGGAAPLVARHQPFRESRERDQSRRLLPGSPSA
eukprot:scaffold15394_cov111-Isochrysis_galbana.AAC.3